MIMYSVFFFYISDKIHCDIISFKWKIIYVVHHLKIIWNSDLHSVENASTAGS